MQSGTVWGDNTPGGSRRWQHGEVALRWTAAGVLATETRFRHLKGHQQLLRLLAALEEVRADQLGADSTQHAEMSQTDATMPQHPEGTHRTSTATGTSSTVVPGLHHPESCSNARPPYEPEIAVVPAQAAELREETRA